MPFINISIAGTKLSDVQKQYLFNETTRLMSDVMGKNPDLTSVRVDEFPATNWAVGRQAMVARGGVAVHMDIKVTEGTNSDEEKAEMINQSMLMLRDVVGRTPKASYIVIHDLEATAWGYDGQTQHARANPINAPVK